MLLDFYGHTLDDAKMAMYMPLLTGTLDFFARHYGDVTKPNATLTIFPTQVPHRAGHQVPLPHQWPRPTVAAALHNSIASLVTRVARYVELARNALYGCRGS